MFATSPYAVLPVAAEPDVDMSRNSAEPTHEAVVAGAWCLVAGGCYVTCSSSVMFIRYDKMKFASSKSCVPRDYGRGKGK
jgi:hypothetical protein